MSCKDLGITLGAVVVCLLVVMGITRRQLDRVRGERDTARAMLQEYQLMHRRNLLQVERSAKDTARQREINAHLMRRLAGTARDRR